MGPCQIACSLDILRQEWAACLTGSFISACNIWQSKCSFSRDLKISIERKRDPNHAGEYFEFFGGMQFKDGYLYKGVSLKSIDSNGVVPSFDELQKFQKPTDEGGPDTMGLPTALMSKRKGLFVKGDAVIVVQGDLKNLMGYVEKVDDDDVFVRPKDKELKVMNVESLPHIVQVYYLKQ